MAKKEDVEERYPLSVGEVLRDSSDWWMKDAVVDSQRLHGSRMLLEAVSSFSGFVGESIECYSYCIVSWESGAPVLIPIKSVEDYKREVYPYQFKKARIASWRAMKDGTLFGWSEDPRPYVE